MAEGYVLSKGKRGCVLMHVRERGGVWPRVSGRGLFSHVSLFIEIWFILNIFTSYLRFVSIELK